MSGRAVELDSEARRTLVDDVVAISVNLWVLSESVLAKIHHYRSRTFDPSHRSLIVAGTFL